MSHQLKPSRLQDMRVLRNARKQNKGVTLVELVISIVIVSIAMIALMNAFGISIAQSSDPLWRNKTLKLAQLYLDEILAKRYDDSTPVGGLPPYSGAGCDTSAEAGEVRATFDDVGDYNGITNQVPTSIIANLDSSYDDYRVSVTVACDGTAVGASANNMAKRITVSITPPNQNTVDVAVYRGNF